MQKAAIHQAIIVAYRQFITDRYQFDQLKKAYDLPTGFDEKRIELFRNYFLEYIYPAPTERQALEEAFENLAAYIKQPEKLLRILVNSSGLLFKYGRHLPKMVRAGLKALQSFIAAKELEKKLVESALKLQLEPPFSAENIQTIIAHLPKKDILDFISTNETLFETLYDRKLVKSVLDIIETLIAKMKKRPQTYSPAEIDALLLGRDIIKKGNLLFDELSKKEQRQVLALVLKIEKDVISTIFK